MPVSSRLHRPLAAAVLGAALLVPLHPVAPAAAAPRTRPAPAAQVVHPRATQTTLTAYGDPDGSGRIHLSGSVRWANGSRIGHRATVELWARSGTGWVALQKAVTDRRGEVELGVAPGAHTTYRLHYAGSTRAAAPAKASTSSTVRVRAVARVTLATPATARRGATFVVTGAVRPAGAGRVVTLTGDGRTFTTLRTRADGSYSGHVCT